MGSVYLQYIAWTAFIAPRDYLNGRRESLIICALLLGAHSVDRNEMLRCYLKAWFKFCLFFLFLGLLLAWDLFKGYFLSIQIVWINFCWNKIMLKHYKQNFYANFYENANNPTIYT